MSAWTLRLDDPAHLLALRGQRVGFVLLAAFLASFLMIRTSARLRRSPKVRWWPGSVTTSNGIHLHHLVWGITLVLVAGFLQFVTRPGSHGSEILAGVFGVGAGLTLDEFALWIHLRDVYWAEEGRASFDAVVYAALLGGLLVVGVAPFDLPNNAPTVGTVIVVVTVDVLLAAAAISKGRRLLGLIGIFVPLVSLLAVLRLAAPHSPWARRLYRPDGRKLARAESRWRRIDARRRRLADVIIGAAGPPEAIDATPASAVAVEAWRVSERSPAGRGAGG
ncbi:MAG: hypothetical protein ACYCXW_06840 [Solirubrobacteraceae bacterium]